GQRRRQTTLNDQDGNPVRVETALDYGLLVDGTWTRRTAQVPDAFVPRQGDVLDLRSGDVSAPGNGWGALAVARPTSSPDTLPLLLGRFEGDHWSWGKTHLDALDLDGNVAAPKATVLPTALFATPTTVWIGATVVIANTASRVVARYEPATGTVSHSWCAVSLRQASCDETLNAE